MRYHCRQRSKVASARLGGIAALLLSAVDSSTAAAASRSASTFFALGGSIAPSGYNDQRPAAAAAFVATANPSRKRPRQFMSSAASLARSLERKHVYPHIRSISSPTSSLYAKPKSGSIVDTYQTVSVNCSKCRCRLFRYKKKNGTKSNLIKCYIERISEDTARILEGMSDGEGGEEAELEGQEWSCPSCGQRFGRRTLIHGRPAIKLVGGKVRMTKK